MTTLTPAEKSQTSSNRLVVKNFIFIGLSEIIGRALTAVSTIYLARTLDVTNYGILGFAATLVLYFSAIVDWGIDLFGPNKVAEDNDQIGDILFPTIIVRLAISVILAFVLIVFGFVFLTSVEAKVLGIYSLLLITVAINVRWIHLGLEKTRVIAIVRLVSELVKVLIIFTLVKDAGDLF